MSRPQEPQMIEFVDPINALLEQAMQDGVSRGGPSTMLSAGAAQLMNQISRAVANGYERGVQEGIRLAQNEGSGSTEGG